MKRRVKPMFMPAPENMEAYHQQLYDRIALVEQENEILRAEIEQLEIALVKMENEIEEMESEMRGNKEADTEEEEEEGYATE